MPTPGIPENVRGSLDGIVEGAVGGWAYDAADPTKQVEIEILVDGEVVGRTTADRYRPDLADAGIRDGRCAFLMPMVLDDWTDGREHEIRARAAGTDLELDQSPQNVVLGGATRTGRPAPFAADTVVRRTGSLDAVRAALEGNGRLAVVAAFQPPGPVPGYLLNYLRALRDHGTAVVVVDTSGLGMAVPEDVAPLVLHRQNIGWDIASWLAGIDAVRDLLPDIDELLLTNDSVFGPLFPLAESWEHPAVQDADFWGLTDSWSIAYHVQSYFLVLKRRVLEHPAFWTFLEQYPFPTAKRQVVRDGEIGLTQALLAAGLRSGVTCPYDAVAGAWLDGLSARLQRIAAYPEHAFLDAGDLDRALGSASAAQSLRHTLEAAHYIRRGLALNGSHFFWDTLVEDFRMPLLKRDLVQLNPAEIPFATELRRVLAPTGYDLAHIREAARRTPEARVVTI